jgi:hypothetical protein
MASDTKTPVEVARELAKAIGAKIDELKKSASHAEPAPHPDAQEFEACGKCKQKVQVLSTGKLATHDCSAKKMELPQTSEKAIGGQMNKDEIVASSKAKCPSCGKQTAIMHESESGRKIVGACDSCRKRNVNNAQKMELPQTSEKAIGGQITKKSEYTAADVAQAIAKATCDRIDALKSELIKMEALEAAGNAALKKNIGSLPSATPSGKQIADGDADNMSNSPRNVFTIMKKGEGKFAPYDKGAVAPEIGEEVSAEGSGGQVKKGKKLAKEALMPQMPKAPALKPTGTPGAKAGEAPKAPKPPQAAGAAPSMHKMDLPHTPEKANGGQMSKEEMAAALDKAYISPYHKYGPAKPVAKPAAAPAPETKPPEAKKMELPQTSEKANGGQMKKDELPMAKGMHPSPVFHALKPRLGGKDQASQHMTSAASQHAATAGAPAPAPKAVKLPSVEDHAARASQFSDFMPAGKFGKSELDSAKCPGCKKGMTLCKCK